MVHQENIERVMKFLYENNTKAYMPKEIAVELNISVSAVKGICRQLKKRDAVKKEIVKKKTIVLGKEKHFPTNYFYWYLHDEQKVKR